MPAPEGMLRALGAGRDGLVVSPGGRGGGLGMPTLRNARLQAAARPLVYTEESVIWCERLQNVRFRERQTGKDCSPKAGGFKVTDCRPKASRGVFGGGCGVWRRLRGETRAAGVVAWVLTVLEAGVRIARSS